MTAGYSLFDYVKLGVPGYSTSQNPNVYPITMTANTSGTYVAINQSGQPGSYNLDVTGSTRVSNVLYMNNQVQNQIMCLYTYDTAPNSASSNYYGFGINGGTLRYNVPASQNHTWYTGASQLATLNGAGLTVSGNVGINTVTPSYTLDVNGVLNARGDATQYGRAIRIAETTYSNSARAAIQFGTGWEMGQDSSGSSAKTFYLYNSLSGGYPLLISNNNYVGINSSGALPVYPLDVQGSTRITTTQNASGGMLLNTSTDSLPTLFLLNQAHDNIQLQFDHQYLANGATISSSSAGVARITKGGGSLSLQTGVGTAGQAVAYNAASISIPCSSGNVGIFQATPAYALDVNGSVRLTSGRFGDVGYGQTYTGFAHTYTANAGSYSFLSDNAGCAFMNSFGGTAACYFRSNNVNQMVIQNGVGIGYNYTSSNGYWLDVNGPCRFTGSVVSGTPVQYYYKQTTNSAISTGTAYMATTKSMFTYQSALSKNTTDTLFVADTTGNTPNYALISIPFSGIWSFTWNVRFSGATIENAAWVAPWVASSFGETSANSNGTRAGCTDTAAYQVNVHYTGYIAAGDTFALVAYTSASGVTTNYLATTQAPTLSVALLQRTA